MARVMPLDMLSDGSPLMEMLIQRGMLNDVVEARVEHVQEGLVVTVEVMWPEGKIGT